MLLNLLPGLRELRAPLAAGYLWVATGWLYLAPKLTRSPPGDEEVSADIYRLAEDLGTTYVLVGVTFAAYLIGIVSAGLLTPVLRGGSDKLVIQHGSSAVDRLRRLVVEELCGHMRDPDLVTALVGELGKERALDVLWPPGAMPASPGYYTWRRRWNKMRGSYADASVEDIRREICERVLEGDRIVRRALVLEVARRAVDVRQRELREELSLVPEKLVADRPAAFDRWDRLSSEAEFRFAVVPPLWVLMAALAVSDVIPTVLAIIAAVFVLAVLWQARVKENEAVGQLIQQIEAGFPPSPTLQRIAAGEDWGLGEGSHGFAASPLEGNGSGAKEAVATSSSNRSTSAPASSPEAPDTLEMT